MKKNKQVIVRLTDEEKQRLKKNAHENYKTMSEYIRTKIS